MWLSVFFFFSFLLGIFQIYILFNIKEYYKEIRIGMIKKLTSPNYNDNLNIKKTYVQFFNLISHITIMVGFLTKYWYIYLFLMFLIIIYNGFQERIKSEDNRSGKKINRHIKQSKFLTYTIVILKSIILFGMGLLHFHGVF